MVSVRARLDRLEARREELERRRQRDDALRENWIVRQGIRWRERLGPTRQRSRDLIALFRTQDKLPTLSADELIERILEWKPPKPGITRSAVEREVARAILLLRLQGQV